MVAGTRGDLIPSITNKGLLVPGTAPGVEHVTDSGWYPPQPPLSIHTARTALTVVVARYGCGIYLSPNPDVAQGYAADGKMLVCAVLMGRIYTCPAVMEGVGCRRGYDSHTSPCGEELILFDAAQVLPCYLVVFGAS
jgi:aprataxin and PNK-like factor